MRASRSLHISARNRSKLPELNGPMNRFVDALATGIADKTGLPRAEVAKLIEVPKDPKMGDYAFPCFALAKSFSTPPKVKGKFSCNSFM